MKHSKNVYFMGILILVASVLLLARYFWGNENFTASTCRFKKLGTYKLSTTPLTDADTGKIYISGNTSWDNITARRPDDNSYTYTSFSPVDASGVLVKQLINNVMKCNGIDVYDNQLGINTKPALILCLEATVPAVAANTTVTPNIAAVPASISRVFFVKSWVPFGTSSVNNVIVGEIAGNETSNQAYKPPSKAVGVLQGKQGRPYLRLTYTLSYTICPAGSRPEGFSYTDCCSGISPRASVAPIAMTNSDTGCCNSNNVCTPLLVKKSKGEDCTTGLDCNSGNCQYGKCGDILRVGAAEGETCATTNDCGRGLRCSDSKKCTSAGAGVSQYCIQNPRGYDPNTGRACSQESGPSVYECSDNYDCASPTSCVNGKCKLPDSDSSWSNRDWARRGRSEYDPSNLFSDSKGRSDDKLPSESERPNSLVTGLGNESRRWNNRESAGWDSSNDRGRDSTKWSGDGNRHRGSHKDYRDQNERLGPQKYDDIRGGSMKSIKPGYNSCNKFYDCNGDADDDTCEGFASLNKV